MGDRAVRPGDTVLVIGTGGVATAAMMIAKGADADIAAVVRHGEHVARLREMGVGTVVDSSQTPE